MSSKSITAADLRPSLARTGTNHWHLRYDGADCKFAVRSEEAGHIYHLYVPPLERGRGIGTATVELAMEVMAAEGVDRVTMEVRAADGATAHLFSKLGFETETVRKSDPDRSVVAGERRIADDLASD